MKKAFIYLFIVAACSLISCGRTINVKWWLMDYQLHNDGFIAIDTFAKDTTRLKVGDRLPGEPTSIDIDIFKWDDTDFYNHLRDNHKDLLKKEIGTYRDDSTSTYEYESVPLCLNTEVKRDSIIQCVYIAHELYDKYWRTVVAGNLSGENIFVVAEKERRGWNYKNNISATANLSYGASWWGTPCYQLKVEIKNISSSSWSKRFDIRVEGYDKNNHLIGEESMSVDDFVVIGESMSKTAFITDFQKRIIYAEYFRLYIDNVYFGEFLN